MCWMSLQAQIEMDTFANLTSVSLCPSLCRSTDHWRWRKKASRHATARCPASPSGTSEHLRASTSSPSACTTRRCPSPAVPWLPTCPTWATCLLSATQATCCPRRPPSTRRSATRTTRVARLSGLSLTEDPWNQQTFLFDLHQWGVLFFLFFFFYTNNQKWKEDTFLVHKSSRPQIMDTARKERGQLSLLAFLYFVLSHFGTAWKDRMCVRAESLCACTSLTCMCGFRTLNQRKIQEKKNCFLNA